MLLCSYCIVIYIVILRYHECDILGFDIREFDILEFDILEFVLHGFDLLYEFDILCEFDILYEFETSSKSYRLMAKLHRPSTTRRMCLFNVSSGAVFTGRAERSPVSKGVLN